ncbi:GPW/gp25 family protein (plasmid) [Sphingomonas parapaucimobilis]
MIGMNRDTGKVCEGVDHLNQSIDDILGTPMGTLIGSRDYGSLVPEQIDQPNNALGRARIFAAAALALLRLEPRARISRITLSPGGQPHQVVLTVTGRRTDIMGAPTFSTTTNVCALSALVQGVTA